MNETEKYWRQMLRGFTLPSPLVVDKVLRRLAAGTKKEFGEKQIRLSVKETNALQSLARQHGLNLRILAQGAWALLLCRYNGEEDILYGVNSNAEIFPVRVKVSPGASVLSWLKKLRDQQRQEHQFESASLTQIQQWSEVPSDLPLFESVVLFDEQATIRHEYALVIMAIPGPQLKLRILYDKNRFDEATIGRMLGHLQTLLSGMTANPEQPLCHLQLLTEAERHQVQVEWNNTRVDYPEDKCLHQLFEAQAEHTPDAVAVIFANKRLTYKELNRRANQLAHYLRRLGVGPDVVVGMFMERSLEMVIGLYGILKAGGAYVPLDPSYPKERLAYMIEDAQVSVLVTTKLIIDNCQLSMDDLNMVCLDADWGEIAKESQENPVSELSPEHLAYVIYTSGSSGSPKGAVLNHRGRVNNFCDFNRRYSVGPGDKVLGLASLSFDMHAFDNFGLMAAGGANVIVESSAILEPARWAELMIQHEITVWHSVPALLEMYVNYIKDRPELWPQSLRLVLLGGDWIPVNLPDRLKSLVKRVHVVSMGGATECSMDSTIYDIEEPSSGWKSIPYGVPMANQLAYTLDSDFNPVPVGVPSELYLGGVGVGRGYHNRPQLTAEKFVPNPFGGVPGDRMYRTGDLARYMPDGNLELLGRIDFQVKVRGFRVELGEIISTLCQHSAVKEAVVVAKDIESGVPTKGKHLVAYVVPQLQPNESEETRSEEWHTEQISQWQQIYEETYSERSEIQDPTFNIIGWNSSYTGLPIPEEEMHEWVSQSIERILELRPRRVLELACGTGLLLFRVAPRCEKYVGTDFSEVGLNYVRQQLARPELHMPQVSLMQRMADNFEGIEPNSFDLVILHSVVQLFPGVDYLMRVLEGAVNAVQPSGFVYIGDVISLPLMETFHTSVQLYQAPSWTSREQLRQRIKKARSKEEQLFIDPAFFSALKQHLPQITHAQIQLRRGRHLNEMTRFRYDVILQVGSEPHSNPEIQWLDWQQAGLSVPGLKRLLADTQPEFLGIRGVPNARLAADMEAVELLANSDGPETVGQLRETLSQLSSNGFVDPEELWAIGDELPYDVYVTWSGYSSDGMYDVQFVQKTLDDSSPKLAPAFFDEGVSPKPWNNYANNPLQSVYARQLVPELRTYLQKKLPDYMVPSAFVLLDALPLSPNGKVDRRALPLPDESRPELTADFAPPRNPLEEVVASIWAEVFEFEKVGIHDNFLEMGGHSLLAIQIMTRLQDNFPVELPLRYLFASPTVAKLSQRIQVAGQEAQVDVVEVARALIQINQLSDDEVKSMLAASEEKL